MPVSPGSVSSKGAGQRLLAVGLNWLGDAVMSMPALAVLRNRQPDASITLLVRPALTELWSLCPYVDRVEVQTMGVFGTLRTAVGVRRGGYATAWVMPKSFRSALLARLGQGDLHEGHWLVADRQTAGRGRRGARAGAARPGADAPVEVLLDVEPRAALLHEPPGVDRQRAIVPRAELP